jgi:hypothetical protein
VIDVGAKRAVNHRVKLDTTILDLDADCLARSYARTVATSPQRPLRRKAFLVDHDGGGDAASTTSEKVVAKAMYNEKSPLSFDGRAVRLIDYEVPLRAHQADGGVGEIDLLGFDETTHRPWIIELKLAPSSETPLKALIQALRYKRHRRCQSTGFGPRVEGPVRVHRGVLACRVGYRRRSSVLG